MKIKDLDKIREIIEKTGEDLIKSEKTLVRHMTVDLELMKAIIDSCPEGISVYTHSYDGKFYSYSEIYPIIRALETWQTKKAMLSDKTGGQTKK